MISSNLRELQARRAHLVALASRQRADIARGFEAWERAFSLLDRGISVWNFLKSHPLLLGAAMSLVVILRPRRAVTWLSSAVALWRLYRTARLRFAGK
jgi:hypothetical protein